MGFPMLEGSVWLPGWYNLSEYEDKEESMKGEAPYVYLGGWAPGPGSAVDAGFQGSFYRNDWAPFIKPNTDLYGMYNGPRFRPNSQVFMRFTALDNAIELYFTGVTIHGTFIRHTIGKRFPPSARWRSSGNHCVLKRMTSIAQPYGETKLDTGHRVCSVIWSNWMVARKNRAHVRPLLPNDVGQIKNHPGPYENIIFVRGREGIRNETVSIQLRQPSRPPVVLMPEVAR